MAICKEEEEEEVGGRKEGQRQAQHNNFLKVIVAGRFLLSRLCLCTAPSMPTNATQPPPTAHSPAGWDLWAPSQSAFNLPASQVLSSRSPSSFRPGAVQNASQRSSGRMPQLFVCFFVFSFSSWTKPKPTELPLSYVLFLMNCCHWQSIL